MLFIGWICMICIFYGRNSLILYENRVKVQDLARGLDMTSELIQYLLVKFLGLGDGLLFITGMLTSVEYWLNGAFSGLKFKDLNVPRLKREKLSNFCIRFSFCSSGYVNVLLKDWLLPDLKKHLNGNKHQNIRSFL